MSRLTPVTEADTVSSNATSALAELMEEARSLLELGNLHRFKHLVDENRSEFRFNHAYDDGFSLPIILVQSYKKVEATMGKGHEMPIDDYCQCIRWLARKGADLNRADNSSRTVLHWCILTQTPDELFSTALQAGANPALQDDEGQTVLHLAIRMGCPDLVNLIVQSEPFGRPALETASSLSGATPLMYAVQIKSCEFVEQLLRHGALVDRQEENKYRRTALHYSLYVNSTEIFELLLRSGAKTNIADFKEKTVEARAADHPNGTFKKMLQVYAKLSPGEKANHEFHPTTPLMFACQDADLEAAQNLVEDGDSVDEIDDGGRNALHYCAESEDTACAEFLLQLRPELAQKKDNDGYTPLHLAAIAGNAKLVHLLVQNGADLNALDNERRSSVHWGVVTGQVETLKSLLDLKAKCQSTDIFGATPLHYAAQLCGSSTKPNDQNSTKILELLLAKTRRVDCLDAEKRSPLLWAASMGAKKACELLLKKGAKVQLADRAGLTVLHCAASRGQVTIIDLMVKQHQADVDICDKNNCSPLFYAVTLNQLDCVKRLLKLGADANLQDINGRSVAHYAATKNHQQILHWLQQHGANLWLPNSQGDLPIHEAVQCGHLEIVRFLAADPNAQLDAPNGSGHACLHVAAYRNRTQMCNAILRNGATVNLSTTSNQGHQVTALDLVRNSECKEFIRRYGGQYQHEIDNSEAPDQRQTITLNITKHLTIPITRSNSRRRSVSVQSSEPYAEAIRRAEAIIAKREGDLQRDDDDLFEYEEAEEEQGPSRRPSIVPSPLPPSAVELNGSQHLQEQQQQHPEEQPPPQVQVPAPESTQPQKSELHGAEGSASAATMMSDSTDYFYRPRPRLNKPHKVPYFWQTKAAAAPAVAANITQEPADKRIRKSVQQYQQSRQDWQNWHKHKRTRIYEGAVADRMMLKYLQEEYRKFCLYEESYFDASSLADSSTEEDTARHKKDSKFNEMAKETGQLYSNVHQRAEEMLKMAREINCNMSRNLTDQKQHIQQMRQHELKVKHEQLHRHHHQHEVDDEREQKQQEDTTTPKPSSNQPDQNGKLQDEAAKERKHNATKQIDNQRQQKQDPKQRKQQQQRPQKSNAHLPSKSPIRSETAIRNPKLSRAVQLKKLRDEQIRKVYSSTVSVPCNQLRTSATAAASATITHSPISNQQN